jgi:hypothetical protein
MDADSGQRTGNPAIDQLQKIGAQMNVTGKKLKQPRKPTTPTPRWQQRKK